MLAWSMLRRSDASGQHRRESLSRLFFLCVTVCSIDRAPMSPLPPTGPHAYTPASGASLEAVLTPWLLKKRTPKPLGNVASASNPSHASPPPQTPKSPKNKLKLEPQQPPAPLLQPPGLHSNRRPCPGTTHEGCARPFKRSQGMSLNRCPLLMLRPYASVVLHGMPFSKHR